MEHILSLSYGKDSLACLGAIKELGLPLDRIIHAEIWATKTIPADLPPMIEFKAKADKIIKERYGITVEHVSAVVTYEDVFYRILKSGGKSKNAGHINGFPMIKGVWCNSMLKVSALNKHNQSIRQLRLLRRNYPEYWNLLLKWDIDSPISFKPSHTVHDFEERFQLEDKGIIFPDDSSFKWKWLNSDIQLKFFA